VSPIAAQRGQNEREKGEFARVTKRGRRAEEREEKVTEERKAMEAKGLRV